MSLLNPKTAFLIPIIAIGLAGAGFAIDGDKIARVVAANEHTEIAVGRVKTCIPYVDKGRIIDGEVYVTHEPDPKRPGKTIEQKIGDGAYICDLANTTAMLKGSSAMYTRSSDVKAYTKAMANRFGVGAIEGETIATMPTPDEIIASGAVVAHVSKNYRPNVTKRVSRKVETPGNWFMKLFQPTPRQN